MTGKLAGNNTTAQSVAAFFLQRPKGFALWASDRFAGVFFWQGAKLFYGFLNHWILR